MFGLQLWWHVSRGMGLCGRRWHVNQGSDESYTSVFRFHLFGRSTWGLQQLSPCRCSTWGVANYLVCRRPDLGFCGGGGLFKLLCVHWCVGGYGDLVLLGFHDAAVLRAFSQRAGDPIFCFPSTCAPPDRCDG